MWLMPLGHTNGLRDVHAVSHEKELETETSTQLVRLIEKYPNPQGSV